ncbi:hypothetical protein ACQFYA_20980 [Promicromonospora sp. Marseille-Q5078]
MSIDQWWDEPAAESLPPQLHAELHAAAADHVAAGHDARTWLAHRWAALDRHDPIVDIDVNYTLFREHGTERLHVDFHYLAAVDGERRWGLVNNRPESYDSILEGLREGYARGDFGGWVREMGAPTLMELPGPYGSLYEVASDGRHRSHVLRALGVSLFAAWVHRRSPAVEPGARIYLGAPMRFHTYSPREPGAEARAAAGHRRALRRHAEHVGVLVDHGVIRAAGEADYYEVVRGVPAAWALAHPDDAVRISRRYRRSFPQFGEAVEGERALLSRQGWLSYLKRTAPARALAVVEVGSRRRGGGRWR